MTFPFNKPTHFTNSSALQLKLFVMGLLDKTVVMLAWTTTAHSDEGDSGSRRDTAQSDERNSVVEGIFT
jgi:hypothetical protein